MANRDALQYSTADRAWLEDYMPKYDVTQLKDSKPFVTLTFATSLDSALSISPGVQTALSGPQSKAMTHYLRSRHDAILVGVGTAVADNPSLNCRLEGTGGYGGEGLEGQPRPVIIDPQSRWNWSEQAKVIQLASSGRGKAPWIVTCRRPPPDRAELLAKVGGEYIVLESGVRTGISWTDILVELTRRSILSIMIEGGAKVINTLLAPSESHLIDSIIVTVAPVWLGADGLRVLPERSKESERGKVPVARLKDTKWQQLGDDVVLCGRIHAAQ
ncbi:RibD C-terminal domain-containing protein [Elsinoe fawcettii]|nr:RibD C-terminal domain-containing protein [Elsinoe fawcettii]